MRTIAGMALLAAALTVAQPARAQQTETVPGSSPEQLIGTIEKSRENAEAINALDEVGGVELVTVDTLSGGEASRAIENAVSLNEYDVRSLQSALEDRPEVSARLENDGVELRNVVAADVEQDRVVLYVRKQ